MDLIGLVFTIAIVGVILWAINTYVPMQSGIKNILNVVVIIVLLIWLLGVFGVMSHIPNMTIGR